MKDRQRVRSQLHASPDEFVTKNANGETVRGKFNNKGEFIIDERDKRANAAFIDEEGFLTDANGIRIVSREMAERRKLRRAMKKQ